MTQDDDALAIPLWIGGHAYLTLAPGFVDVRNPATGQLLRRTPLCGPAEADQAVACARGAAAGWRAQSDGARAGFLAAVGDALAGYAAHFARLIVEESGQDVTLAAAEVADAIALLRGAPGADAQAEAEAEAVVAIVGNRLAPLCSALRIAVPALRAGLAVVVRPSPETPSALFAFAELTGRCDFPPGVFNVLHGGDGAVAGLRAAGLTPLFAGADHE